MHSLGSTETTADGNGPATRVTLLNTPSIEGPAGVAPADDLPGAQPKTTFAYLVLHRGAPVPLERLGEAVWGPKRPATWRPALRALVSKVRAFVGTAAPRATLVMGPGGYDLDLPGPVEVDVEVARRCARRAEQALQASQTDAAVAHAARATDLAAGAFLPRSGSRWVRVVAEELHDIRLRTLHVLGEVHLLRGEPERAARAANEAITLAPLLEASHRLAMRAYNSAGESGEAAQAFDRCRTQLRDQLGINPSTETTELLTAILRD